MNMNNQFSPQFSSLGAAQTDALPVAPLFEKRTVTELSDSDLTEVNGGSTPATPTIAASLGAAWLAVQIGKAGYEFGKWLAR